MAISTLTAEHVGMGLIAIGVVIFAGMLTIRLFSSSGDWPLLLPIAIIGVVISYVGFALVLADNSRRARSCECSCTVSPAHSVYACRKGLTGVAGDLDMSPSELTKRLNADTAEPRPLRAGDVEDIIRSTGDMTPIYWLCEKFLQDDEAKKKAALAALAALAPQLGALLEQAGLRRVA